jgi:hypothetical protein
VSAAARSDAPHAWRVMIRCSVTGESVWTGVTMHPAALAGRDDLAINGFVCPLCDQLHTWSKHAAWLDDE